MRQIVLLVVVGLAAATGCGGPGQDVRVYSSVPVEPPQRKLDQIGAGWLNGLFSKPL